MNWYLYNASNKDINLPKIRIEIKKGQTINLKIHNQTLTDELIMDEIENGCLFDFILSNELIISHTDNRMFIRLPEVRVDAKPFARRTLGIRYKKEESSRFIEELQSAFDGKVLHEQHEDLISKNTSSLLSESDFDGTSDPLEDE